jgi:hypothetical protein
VINIKTDVDLSCQNLSNVEALEVGLISGKDNDIQIKGNVDLSCQNLSNVEALEVGTIFGKSDDLLICNDGDLILKPTGNLILHNLALDFDLTKSNIYNVQEIFGSYDPPCPLNINVADGFKIEITGGDGIDLNERDLCNVDVVETNVITNDGNLQLSPKGDVIITSNVDLSCKNVSNIESIEVGTITGKYEDIEITSNVDLSCKNVSNIESLEVNVISSKDKDLLICNDGDLILKPTGNLILHNLALDFDLTKSNLYNVQEIYGSFDPACPLNINVADGFKIEITGGDGIAMNGRDICSANVIEANTITSNGNLTISPIDNVIITSNVDLSCKNLSNVESLEINTIIGKDDDIRIVTDSPCSGVCIQSNGAVQVKSNKVAFFDYKSEFPAQEKYINKLITMGPEKYPIFCIPTCANTVAFVDSKITALSKTGNAATFSQQSAFKNLSGNVVEITQYDQSFAFCEANWNIELDDSNTCITVLVQAVEDYEMVRWCAVTDVYYLTDCLFDPCETGDPIDCNTC